MDIPKKSASELLRDLLDEHGLTYTAFGERMGYKEPYTAAYEMLEGGKFGKLRQKKVIAEFGLRDDHFADPDQTVRRRKHFQLVFAKFLETDIGKMTSPDNLKSIRGYQVHGPRLPTVHLLQSIAIAIEDDNKYSEEQLAEAVRRGDRMERVLSQKAKKLGAGAKSPKRSPSEGEPRPRKKPRSPKSKG